MTALDFGLLTATDEEVKQQFEEFIQTEKHKGLADVKFAMASSAESTVVDAMRQIMMLKSLRAAGQLQEFHD